MRRTAIGLAAAALLILAACGGDDDDASGDNGSSEGQSAPGSGSQFCEEFTELTEQGPAAGSDPASVIEAMRGLHPPEEIAEDFALTIEGAELQAEMASGGTEEPDPDLVAQFQENQEAYTSANQHIQEYISTECGLGSGPPSSQPGD
jgi:hypothetical protein